MKKQQDSHKYPTYKQSSFRQQSNHHRDQNFSYRRNHSFDEKLHSEIDFDRKREIAGKAGGGQIHRGISFSHYNHHDGKSIKAAINKEEIPLSHEKGVDFYNVHKHRENNQQQLAKYRHSFSHGSRANPSHISVTTNYHYLKSAKQSEIKKPSSSPEPNPLSFIVGKNQQISFHQNPVQKKHQSFYHKKRSSPSPLLFDSQYGKSEKQEKNKHEAIHGLVSQKSSVGPQIAKGISIKSPPPHYANYQLEKYQQQRNFMGKSASSHSNGKRYQNTVNPHFPETSNFNSEKKADENNFFEYVMRFSYKTKKGFIPNNNKKVNQDSYIMSTNINQHTWEHLFGICDGHGPLGHLVSNYIKEVLPKTIENTLKKKKYLIGNAKGNKNININKQLNYLVLQKGFEQAYEKLLKQSHIDMSFSGSTVIVCYFNEDKLYCANVGDSRAIVARTKAAPKDPQRKENKQIKGQWEVIQLSTDHKPTIQAEALRIKQKNGRIQAYKDQMGEQIGPLRVWLQKQNVPGLAMTRSFGDLVGASVGVSHEPQIKEYKLTENDKIILVASDGVFEFLENEEIINELKDFYIKKQVQKASDHLLDLAHKSWRQNSSIIDDITFVLIFLYYGEV